MPRKPNGDAAAPTNAQLYGEFSRLMHVNVLTPEERTERALGPRERRFQAERDLLVAVLSKLLPAHIMPIKGRKMWTEAVCIHTPAGQVAWTLAVDRLEWFAHLARTANDWDGHSASTRDARLRQLLTLELAPAKSEGKSRKSEGNSRRPARRKRA